MRCRHDIFSTSSVSHRGIPAKSAQAAVSKQCPVGGARQKVQPDGGVPGRFRAGGHSLRRRQEAAFASAQSTVTRARCIDERKIAKVGRGARHRCRPRRTRATFRRSHRRIRSNAVCACRWLHFINSRRNFSGQVYIRTTKR